jgi:hypothetical protein
MVVEQTSVFEPTQNDAAETVLLMLNQPTTDKSSLAAPL